MFSSDIKKKTTSEEKPNEIGFRGGYDISVVLKRLRADPL